ncbi:MAG: hypothetical protein U0J89_01825 [Collinsella sp.]|nr:hypothetical protein [Collinsella sp.]
MALPMVYGGPGRYVQGPGELSRQGRYLSWLGCAAYVLFDQGTEDRLCKQIVDGFLDDDLSEPFFKIYNGPCSAISDGDLQGVANAVFRNERNMANEQVKVTEQSSCSSCARHSLTLDRPCAIGAAIGHGLFAAKMRRV